MSRSKSIGVCSKLGKNWIQFTRYRRSVDYVGTLVTRRLELPRAQNTFFKRGSLVWVGYCARSGIGADERWMWNRNTTLLEASARVSEASTYARIMRRHHLSEGPARY